MGIIENPSYGEQELLYNQFMEPALNSAIHHLALTPGSQGLDAGCGPGGVLALLDRATGGMGCTFGMDNSPTLLEIAREQVETHRLARRVGLMLVDLSQPLPLPDSLLDWAWTADVLCSQGEARGIPDPAAVLR